MTKLWLDLTCIKILFSKYACIMASIQPQWQKNGNAVLLRTDYSLTNELDTKLVILPRCNEIQYKTENLITREGKLFSNELPPSVMIFLILYWIIKHIEHPRHFRIFLVSTVTELSKRFLRVSLKWVLTVDTEKWLTLILFEEYFTHGFLDRIKVEIRFCDDDWAFTEIGWTTVIA